MMGLIERNIARRIDGIHELLQQSTPGLQLQVYRRDKLIADIEWGTTYKYYDLASLTKILFTATWCSHLVSKRLISPDTRVADLWGDWKIPRTKLSDLWTHSAGLPWWEPFYRTLRTGKPESQWKKLEKKLLHLKAKRQMNSVYSDPDLFVTAAAIRHGLDLNLLDGWQALQNSGWTRNLHFNLNNRRKFPAAFYAPTEKCLWRKKTMQGQVHDENAYALGGIAPHAGLFGQIADVSHWALKFRKVLLGEVNEFVQPKVAQIFARRQIERSRGDWGYLFMLPTRGQASCGRFFSSRSIGHTGFTGTSFWMDLKKDLFVIVLSNRINPTRENKGFVSLRPKLHDIVIEEMEK